MAGVNARDVWKVYGGKVEAVKGLNLEIKDGEFVSLLGPSGCGKSSTLRMIAGLEEITHGKLYIGDRLVNNLEPGERDIAMVFENYALLPHMTAYDNIAFPLRLKNENALVVDRKVKEITALLEMGSFLGDRAGSLGGGQKQRVGIARALIKKSSVLLMDEPISHLDADLRARTRGELARLQKLLGLTTIYVTHDQIEALAMADRIAVMNLGELQQFGTPDELYNFPANKFVADFIGEPPMNFLQCNLRRGEGAVRLTSDYFNLTLDGSHEKEITPVFSAGPVWLGVRPVDIRLGGWEETNVIKGTVINCSPGCEHSLIEARVGKETVLIQGGPEMDIKEGNSVYLDMTSTKYHLFNHQTEESIIIH